MNSFRRTGKKRIQIEIGGYLKCKKPILWEIIFIFSWKWGIFILLYGNLFFHLCFYNHFYFPIPLKNIYLKKTYSFLILPFRCIPCLSVYKSMSLYLNDITNSKNLRKTNKKCFKSQLKHLNLWPGKPPRIFKWMNLAI